MSQIYSLKSVITLLINQFLLYVGKISPSLATKLLHLMITKKWPNLESPRDFNEKLQWLKLNEPMELKAICSDKYEVYNYINDNYSFKIMNRLIAVYDNVEKIDWRELPQRFAIKCNHGCGYNLIVDDKDRLDKSESTKIISKWMKQRYGDVALQYHYNLIKPKVIIEEYIDGDPHLGLVDYKVYCFRGVPKLVLVCTNRSAGLRLDFYDLQWNRLPIGHLSNESPQSIPKPSTLSDMVTYASELSKPFTFVRIDFYENNGKVVFGEFTFTPAGNMAKYYNDYGLQYLGNLLSLPT